MPELQIPKISGDLETRRAFRKSARKLHLDIRIALRSVARNLDKCPGLQDIIDRLQEKRAWLDDQYGVIYQLQDVSGSNRALFSQTAFLNPADSYQWGNERTEAYRLVHGEGTKVEIHTEDSERFILQALPNHE